MLDEVGHLLRPLARRMGVGGDQGDRVGALLQPVGDLAQGGELGVGAARDLADGARRLAGRKRHLADAVGHFLRQLLRADRLALEELQGLGHFADFVVRAGGRHFDARVAVGERRHREGQPTQPAGDVAADIDQRQHQEGQHAAGGDDDEEEARLFDPRRRAPHRLVEILAFFLDDPAELGGERRGVLANRAHRLRFQRDGLQLAFPQVEQTVRPAAERHQRLGGPFDLRRVGRDGRRQAIERPGFGVEAGTQRMNQVDLVGHGRFAQQDAAERRRATEVDQPRRIALAGQGRSMRLSAGSMAPPAATRRSTAAMRLALNSSTVLREAKTRSSLAAMSSIWSTICTSRCRTTTA